MRERPQAMKICRQLDSKQHSLLLNSGRQPDSTQLRVFLNSRKVQQASEKSIGVPG